ncbi:MAG: vanadium-dependent haloperoxidase [Pseudomonadota bacterium]
MTIDQNEAERIKAAKAFRTNEAKAAAARATARSKDGPLHRRNRDEELLNGGSWAMSFTKGLAHDEQTGLVSDGDHAMQLRDAIDGDTIAPFTLDVEVPSLSTGRRQWEAPTAGYVFDLQGPDAQAVTMPPAPALNKSDGTFDELTFEMAEVYELALVRDLPFSEFEVGSSEPRMLAALERLNALPYVQNGLPSELPDLVLGSQRPRKSEGGLLTANTAFRGASFGTEIGPYLSQFLLIGTGEGACSFPEQQGQIAFGNQRIDQRVRNATTTDWMVKWRDWLAVQNGADVRSNSTLFAPGYRFIHTPRDLATYVHDDALYQAYLNACLILLGMGAPLDPGFGDLAGGPIENPQQPGEILSNNATGFALFGGPHVLSLVTEVATRVLKAVRYQKFQNHLRLRPEALAGRLARAADIDGLPSIQSVPEVKGQLPLMATQLAPVLFAVAAHNVARGGDNLPLLPMAFQEGSPMHPAYGAGHATVAGACVTVLKAFFDTSAELTWSDGTVAFRRPDPSGVVEGIPVQFVSAKHGHQLEMQQTNHPLTLLGELNKLAANISIGRNMAGVHYFSDYYDSVRMGEEIAVGMLEEQAQGYPSDVFSLSLTPFDSPYAEHAVTIERGNRITKSDLRSTSCTV